MTFCECLAIANVVMSEWLLLCLFLSFEDCRPKVQTGPNPNRWLPGMTCANNTAAYTEGRTVVLKDCVRIVFPRNAKDCKSRPGQGRLFGHWIKSEVPGQGCQLFRFRVKGMSGRLETDPTDPPASRMVSVAAGLCIMYSAGRVNVCEPLRRVPCNWGQGKNGKPFLNALTSTLNPKPQALQSASTCPLKAKVQIQAKP